MKKFLNIFWLLLTFTSAAAQQTQVNTLVNQLNDYSKKHLVEKLYVHTDRETYLAGETMWFKIYYVDGFEHKPLDLSKVAYLELLDQENEAVLQLKTSLQEGRGNGSVFIPVTINSGNYLLRAYTSWMQNGAPEFFFQKEIGIINTFKTLGPATAQQEQPVQLELFPEGGQMVENLPASLVCRINKEFLPLQGLLIRNDLDTLQQFSFNEHGLSKISLLPTPNTAYKISLINAEGKNVANSNLSIMPEGYTMQLKDQPEQITISVHTSLKVPMVNLVIHNRQKVNRAETLFMQEGNATISIDKASLGDHVSHITIFDLAGVPVAERLYYNTGSKTLKINLNSNAKNYAPREKVSIEVKTKDENDHPVVANLSVAVKQIFDFEKESFLDIGQYMQLTSDLPAIDFEVKNTDEETMDLLMLTAGWRRFKWENVLQNPDDTIKFQPELNGHIIRGKIINRQDQTTAPYVKGFLSIPGKKAQIFGGLSNNRGDIYFEIRDFYQKNQVVVQTKNDSLYQISLENPFAEKTSSYQFKPFKIDESDAEQLNQRSINLQVQNTYYADLYRQSILPDQDSAAFFGEPDATYYLDEYTRFPTMEDVMREYVANVWVRKNRDGYYYLVYNMPRKDVFKNSSLVILDGVPVFDTDKIIAYDPLNVEKIDLVKRKFQHGLLTCEGIVSYTTYEGNLKNFTLDPHTLIMDYEGLQAKREFFAPEHGQQKHSSMPDFRNLLHWQPEINTTDGEAEVSFYTSDQEGTYLIEVQGMTGNGRFGNQQMIIAVEKTPVN